MLTRNMTSTVAGRASAMRRMRRRSNTRPPYCRTNGCASILEIGVAGVAVCRVCGYTRRLH